MKTFKIVLTVLTFLAPVAFLYFADQLSFLTFALAVGFYCVSTGIHLVAHECGHLLGGAVSGYRLLCLQLGSLRIIRTTDSKLKLRWKSSRHGQCIMIPKNVEHLHYRAYNLGGSFANGLIAALSLLLLLPQAFFWKLLMVELIAVGVQRLTANLLPHIIDSVPSDGFVVRLLSRSAAARRDYGLYLQLYKQYFLDEPVSPEIYQYHREPAADPPELLYYNEIQNLLSLLPPEQLVKTEN